jgi:hypothetical protein
VVKDKYGAVEKKIVEWAARNFVTNQAAEVAGILCVFQDFCCAELGQKNRCASASIFENAPQKKEKEEGVCLPLTLPALVSLGGQDLTAIVGTARSASSVGHDGLTALGANSHIGSGQLPVGATALIAAGRGHFTLRDSHG